MTRATLLNIILVVIALTAVHAAKQSRHTYKKCKKSDPNLNECVRLSIEDGLKKVKDGEPAIGLFPVDPLQVTAIDIPKNSGPVGIRQTYKDLFVHGFATSKLANTKVNLKDFQIQSETITPQIDLVGDYTIDGSILILPIVGDGRCNISMYNVRAVHTLTGTPFMKNNRKYMKIKYDLKLYPKLVHFLFGNLFNGDKLLGDEMYRFTNQNWEVIFNEVKPSYEETFSMIFENVANIIFNRVPFDDIFPED